MVVESWLPRAAARAPRPASRSTTLTYARAAARARRAAGGRRARRAPGDRVGARARRPGEDFVVALHACLLARRARGAGRPAADRAPSAPRASTCCVDAPLPAGAAAEGAAPRAAHDLDAPAIVVHTSGTTSAPKPIRADLRQLAVERARLGGRARRRPGRALAVHAAARARRRPVDPAALGDLRRRPRSSTSASTTERVLAALRDPTARRSSRSSRRRSRACSTPGCAHPPALRWALLGGAPLPARAARRARGGRRPGRADLRPDRGVLAGHDRTACRCSARACALDGPTARSSSSGPDRLARRRGGRRLRTGDLGAPRRATGRLRIVGRKADTIVTGGENVAPGRGRGGARGPPGRRRGRRARPRRPASGARPSSRSCVLRAGAPPTPATLRAHCARAPRAGSRCPRRSSSSDDAAAHRVGQALRRELACASD